MASVLVVLAFSAIVLASLTVEEPSDVIPESSWSADNAIIPDYDVAYISVQPSPG